MSDWLYKGRTFDEDCILPEYFGMVYKVTVQKGEYKGYYYIGSKQFLGTRTKRLSKRRASELYSGKGRKPTREKTIVKKDWINYSTSSKFVKSLIEEIGRDSFKFEVLEFACNRSELHYKELLQLLKSKWESEKCMNLALKFTIYKSQLK